MKKCPLFQEEANLKRFHTYGIDAKAKFLVEVTCLEELSNALSFVKEKGIDFTIIGRGSNVIFKDDYYPGLVIINKMTSYKMVGHVLICEGGVNLPLIARKTAKLHLSGLEALVGVPGTIGGSVFMNAGVLGANISTHIISVEALLLDGTRKIFSNEECKFSYRHSIFQENKAVVTKVIFDLVPDSSAPNVLQENLNARLQTQPIEEKNSGCIFKNPNLKEPAGLLIDKCGLKGRRLGGAQISTKHANFINNSGKAQYEDVLALIHQVKSEVKEQTGVDLEYEIRVL